eukprot:1624621-Pyramimonas_sp.AAC.1
MAYRRCDLLPGTKEPCSAARSELEFQRDLQRPRVGDVGRAPSVPRTAYFPCLAEAADANGTRHRSESGRVVQRVR